MIKMLYLVNYINYYQRHINLNIILYLDCLLFLCFHFQNIMVKYMEKYRK